MTSPEHLASQIQSSPKRQPPVDQWHPPLSGDIAIRIDREGRWYHEGVAMTRQRLVDLFASILWREGDEHFLVTPVEKWRIQVDEEPLLVVLAQREGEGQQARIRLETSTGDIFYLDNTHPLVVDHDAAGQPRPVVRVRYQLDALIHRNVFYQLVDWSVASMDGINGVWSCGEFFPLH